jgi:uncharacterized protein (TIGR03382 family)
MITIQTLTLLQLALVGIGVAGLWFWPHRARSIIAATVAACFAAIGLMDPGEWASSAGPALAIFALLLVSWLGERRR